MTAPRLTTIREAFVSAIEADITTAHVYANFPESFVVPAIIVQGPDIDFHEDTMSVHYVFPLVVLVSEGYDRVAQLTLDGFLDPPGSATSLRGSIESASTLGGVVQYTLADRAYDYGIHEIAGVRYMGAVIDVHVVAYNV